MRLAIIGCSGHVSYVQEALRRRNDLTLAAVAPGNPEEDMSGLIQSLEREGHVFARYDDWRTMLDCEKIELAAVAPWFCYCARISVECLKRGIHVYSEKPLAMSMEELEELTRVWAGSGCALDGMFGIRYASWFLALHQAVERGEIGQVRQIHGQKSYKLGQRGPLYFEQSLYGGILPWVGIHAIDWALQLGGECKWARGLHCRKENRGHGELEVSSAALMELQNGVIATVTADFLRPVGAARHDDDRLRVTGTRGMLEAVDGRVYLENDLPRRELELPEAPAAMAEFLDSIGTERSRELTYMALAATRAALMARDAANEQGTEA